MLGGRNQHALFHQAGRVANPSDVLPNRLNFETIQVYSSKGDAGTCRCRQDLQAYRSSRMEADTLAAGCHANCLFGYQILS